MRLVKTAPETPQFVSFDDWQVRRKSALRRNVRRGIGGMGCFALVGLLSLSVPGFMRGRAISAAAEWMRTAPHIHMVATDPATHAVVFDLVADGDRTSLTRGSEGFRYVRAGGKEAAIGPQFAFYEDPARSARDLREDLVTSLQAFSGLGRRGDITTIGARKIDGQQANGLMLQGAFTRTAVWLDARTNRPVQWTKSIRNADGWSDIWTARITSDAGAGEAAFDLSSVQSPQAFQAKALAAVAKPEVTVPFGGKSIGIRAFELGRTGAVHLLVELPSFPSGTDAPSWDISVFDTTNQTYARSAILRPLTVRGDRPSKIPENLSCFVFVPALPQKGFEPMTVTVRFTYLGPSATAKSLPITVDVPKRFEAPSPSLAPAYLYLDHTADSVNRRLLLACDLANSSYVMTELNRQTGQRTPDQDLLVGMGSDSLLHLMASNADWVSPHIFDVLADRTLPRLQKLTSDSSPENMDRRVPPVAYEDLFSDSLTP